jgi:hypothetical protein
LVGGGDPVLDCYWLARWYHQCPDVFLSMPMSQVEMHMKHTLKIAELRRKARDDDDG